MHLPPSPSSLSARLRLGRACPEDILRRFCCGPVLQAGTWFPASTSVITQQNKLCPSLSPSLQICRMEIVIPRGNEQVDPEYGAQCVAWGRNT